MPAVFPLLMGKKSFISIGNDFYWNYKNEKMVGYHGFGSPTLLIRDMVR